MHFLTRTRLAAIGFPVVILLLVPLRALVIPRLSFTPEELAILDGPTASPFVSRSLGVLFVLNLTEPHAPYAVL